MDQFGVGSLPVHISEALSRVALARGEVVRDARGRAEDGAARGHSKAAALGSLQGAQARVDEKRRIQVPISLQDAAERAQQGSQRWRVDEPATRAGAFGYMPHALSLATLPHSACNSNVFERRNGDFRLTMLAPPEIGLPFGVKPRLILAFLTTQAKLTKSRDVQLGRSFAAFMRALGLGRSTGGTNGSITSLKDQMVRLFSTTISYAWATAESKTITNCPIVSEAQLWWDIKDPDQPELWRSTIRLGEAFFKDICDRAIPVDVNAIRKLKRSPLALDIYVWLTHRMSYLKPGGTRISWASLKPQFGCGYADSPQGTYDFKAHFCMQLRRVLDVYPEARAEVTPSGLILLTSPTHVRPALPKRGVTP